MEETKVVFGSAENGRCGLVFLENETGLVKKKKSYKLQYHCRTRRTH